MATILDTFITRFGFETDKTGLDKAKKGLGDFKATALKFAAGVGAILGGGFLLTKIAETADETIKWADANGVAVESLGELEFATQRQGGSVDGLRGSLSNLNKSIGEVERGTGRAKLAFEDYGLSVKKSNGDTKTADELFVDLNKKFATLSKAQQFDLAMKMGIDKGTILLLQTAPDAISKLRLEAAKLGVLSRQDAARAAEYVDGLTNIAQSINAIKFEVAGFFFEPLSRFFKMVANGISFFRQHKEVLMSLIGVLGLVAAAYAAMGIKAAVAWVLALGPVALIPMLIGLALAALVVLGEDLTSFFSGGESAIGTAVDFYKDLLTSFIKFLGQKKDTIVSGLKEVLGWFRTVGKGLSDFILPPINRAMDAVRSLVQSFKKIPNFSDIPGFDKLKDFFSKDDQDGGVAFGSQLSSTGPTIGALPPSNSLLSSYNQAFNKKTDISISNLNIDAKGGDSKEIAANVSSELKTQLKNTVEDFDSSIDR